jgi:alpha-amylase/alpha-mannosidase (GH57 family)
MIAPYPPYKQMFEIFTMLERNGGTGLNYLSGDFLADLLTWYHLAWCGESVRREHSLAIRLMNKGNGFSHADRKQLFDLIGKLICGIIPRYRELAERGQIEISSTPHYHPLAPLLIDLNSARESMPGCSLPESPVYPNGRERVVAHIESAKKSHLSRFGSLPVGMWPAEGSVSTAMIEVMAEQGCRWAASGESVLANSLQAAGFTVSDREQYLYRPYHIQGDAGSTHCFFRDDRLSDLIGFEYSHWHGKDAAAHFISQIEIIAEQSSGSTPLVSVILDGENAWEYYPYNGYHFLNDLYEALEAHPTIRTTTFSEYLNHRTKQGELKLEIEKELPGLVAGSWVYGDFSTWIGSTDKNRAWDLLCAAKRSYDEVMAGKNLNAQEKLLAERQLCSCESSDWFWWFGDYNPSHSVASFDHLYRHNLMHLYQLLKLPVPEALRVPISHGGGYAEAGGAMRRGS